MGIFYLDSWISLKWSGNVGRKILLYRAMLLCVCAALCIHVMLPGRTGAERRKFTQEFSGKSIPVSHRQSTKGTQAGGGGREDLDRRGLCDRQIDKESVLPFI